MLDDTTYKQNLKSAFTGDIDKTWDTAAEEMAIATDTYLKSGTVTTAVTGTIPPSTTDYGTGVGTINSTQLTTFKNTIIAAFRVDPSLWNDAAQVIANGMDALLQTATAITTVGPSTSPPGNLHGNGSSTSIATTAGMVNLSPDIKKAFSDGKTWDRDEWKTSTGYAIDDNVIYTDIQYKCTTAHTSGVTFDAGKWTVVTTDSFTLLFIGAIKKFIKACVVNTSDSGSGWTGSGVGAIT